MGAHKQQAKSLKIEIAVSKCYKVYLANCRVYNMRIYPRHTFGFFGPLPLILQATFPVYTYTYSSNTYAWLSMFPFSGAIAVVKELCFSASILLASPFSPTRFGTPV